MNRVAITVLLIFLSGLSVCFAQSGEFAPWNSDVRTGDELFHEYGKKNNRSSSVTGGFQGGAYFLVRMFQVFISPQDGANCRHTPTCSAYARGSVARYGAFIGSIMAGERLLRCNPYYPPEFDPVPERIFGE